MKALIALGLIVIGLPLLWLAGEAHKQNCLRDDRTNCSMLPWKSGSTYCDTHFCVKVNQQP